MKLTRQWSSEEQRRDDDEQETTEKRRAIKKAQQTTTLARKLIEATDTIKTESIVEVQDDNRASASTFERIGEAASIPIQKIAIPSFLSYVGYIASLDTQKTPSTQPPVSDIVPILSETRQHYKSISPKYAALLIMLLCIVIFQAFNSGQAQFVGPQGWAYVLGGPTVANNANILKDIGKQPIKAGAKAQQGRVLTPREYVDLIIQNMTLDQKLGQMMIVQFTGAAYSLELSTMVKQYNVGSVLIFTSNGNITDKEQLKGLVRQMQGESPIPLAVAIDQEGGTVDRLITLDGARPSEASIGATGDPMVAQQAGLKDEHDLTSYGINLNLAPVVDVTNVYNAQLDQRTYGNNADIVTKMAGAYLTGLQKSGKVVGTLKHFPGLGDVGVDPHTGVPRLTRSLADLEQIDWTPYRALIQQGNTVHAVMVTHELVDAVDGNMPSSLSYNVVTGILRKDLGFQGVIMTDSLTMEGIQAYYTQGQAAAVAVEAGDDLLMGASTPTEVASMLQGIKQAMSDGKISQQRINDSVRRILLMKYQMGLLHPAQGS